VAVALLTIGCSGPPPPGNPEIGYSIWGFVGQNPTTPAANIPVLLINGDTDRPVANKNTNIFGKYTFSGLKPGYYKIKAGNKVLEAYITTENIRVDIDLSSASGVMNYAAAAVQGATAPGKPGGDPELAKRFSGKWFSFTGGSTLSGGGGSKSELAFCSNGAYYEDYEAGYYGSGTDQYGDQSMAWGAASESGASGTWSIQGTVSSGQITVTYKDGSQTVIEYQQYENDPQCYYFNGRLHCYNGPCE
jgi:hypothetical protein